MSHSFCCHSTKSKIFTFALLILALLISGCGSSGTKSDKSTFTIAVQSDAVRLDPPAISDIPSTNIISDKLYETLVERRPDGAIVPQLATEWTQVNPTTWEFTLRKGVKFQDGTDFNAQAVKITLDRILDKSNSFPRRNLISMIKEVQVIDDHKVRIITEFPFSALLIHLSHSGVSMISPKAIAENDTKPLAQNPCGTGPFKLVKWTKGQEIVMERFDGYWGEKPKIAKAIFKVVPEDATRLAMVKTGEAQAAEAVPVTDAERLSKELDMNLVKSLSYRVEFVAMNTSQAPFNNPKVREAVSLALDFDAIYKGVFSGSGKKEVSTLGPDVFGYTKLDSYPHDIEKAKKLMVEAGYANGAKVILITPDRKIRLNLAEVIQAQLKPLGITVEIRSWDMGTYMEESRKGDFQLNLTGWSNQTGDGDYGYVAPFTKAGAKHENNSRYADIQVEQWVQEARQEMDMEKRKAIYVKIQQKIREDRPVLTTQVTEHLMISKKNVKGLWTTPGGIVVFNDLKVE